MCRPNSSKEGGGLAVYRHGINFELRLGISNFKYLFVIYKLVFLQQFRVQSIYSRTGFNRMFWYNNTCDKHKCRRTR